MQDDQNLVEQEAQEEQDIQDDLDLGLELDGEADSAELDMSLDISGDRELLEELRIGNYPGSPRHEFMEKLEEFVRDLEEKGVGSEAIAQIIANVEEQYRLGNITVKQRKVGNSEK